MSENAFDWIVSAKKKMTLFLDPEEELKLLAGVTGDDLSLAASQLIFPLTNTL